jgi:CheY-like chemotaxis protein
LAEITKRVPSLICTDLIHPDGHGEDLCKALLTSPATESVPVVVLSGQVNNEIELRLYRLGVRAVFRKPWQMADVLKRVRVLLPIHTDLDTALLNVRKENVSLDYKECLPLSGKKERAAFAKDVIAMANAGGGQIIIGVAESPKGTFRRVGVAEIDLPLLETTKVNDAIRLYVGQALSVECRTRKIDQLYFSFIKVPSADLAMVHTEHPEAALFKGRFYIRTDAARSEEIQDPILLQQMLIKAALRATPTQ